MDLIADIGGSSSRWMLLQGDEVKEFSLPGYHPLAKDQDNFVNEAKLVFSQQKDLTKVFAYAAGTDTAPQRIIDTLRKVFPSAELELQNDLMAVARGMCGNSPGAVMILGTGMNFAWYDGEWLHHNMPCLGAILGDEGSGADLGKALLHDAYYGLVPSNEMAHLFPEGIPKLNVTLDEVHHGNAPNQHLASFAKRMSGMEDQPFTKTLLERRFTALAEVATRFYPAEQRKKVYASGSVALGFKDTLQRVFSEHGMELVEVVKDPVQGLIAYHQKRQ